MGELLKVSDLARELRVSEETIRRWIRNKQIDYVAVGPFGAQRVRKQDVLKENSSGRTASRLSSTGTAKETGAATNGSGSIETQSQK